MIRRATRRRRTAMTLVELMVVLAVLGIAAAVVTVALPSPGRATTETPAARLARARREALERARPVTVSIDVGGRVVDATVNTDGSVVADTAIHVDRLAGRPVDAAR